MTSQAPGVPSGLCDCTTFVSTPTSRSRSATNCAERFIWSAVMPFAEIDCNAIFWFNTSTMRLKSDSTRVRISSAPKAVIILDAPYICVCITRIEYRVTNVHCIRSLQTVRPQLESQLEPQRRRHRGRHRASIRHLTLYRHEFVYQEGRTGAGERREQGCTADLRQGPSDPEAQGRPGAESPSAGPQGSRRQP